MNILSEKLKEVLFSVTPIVLIVLVLHFTSLVPLQTPLFVRFIIGSILIILGLAIFLAGVDISISRIGNNIGSFIVKKNKILIVIVAGLLLGFFYKFCRTRYSHFRLTGGGCNRATASTVTLSRHSINWSRVVGKHWLGTHCS